MSRLRPTNDLPGPSITPERVLRTMHRSMPDIYEGELVDLAFSLVEDLPSIARTSGRVFMSISNGHGAWQMALCNTLSPGDKILVLESGLFASVWGQMAERTHLNVEYLSGDNRLPVDPDMLGQRLSKTLPMKLRQSWRPHRYRHVGTQRYCQTRADNQKPRPSGIIYG